MKQNKYYIQKILFNWYSIILIMSPSYSLKISMSFGTERSFEANITLMEKDTINVRFTENIVTIENCEDVVDK